MVSRRVQELMAILLIGDGVVALLQPQRHVRLWTFGPASYRGFMQAFVQRPGMTQLLSAIELGLGIWWASRQRPMAR